MEYENWILELGDRAALCLSTEQALGPVNVMVISSKYDRYGNRIQQMFIFDAISKPRPS